MSDGTLRRLSPLVSGAVLVAWLEVLTDTLHRNGWEGVSRTGHWTAAMVLYTASTALFAAGVGLAFAVYRSLLARLVARRPSASVWFAPACGAVLAMVATSGMAFWTFSGERIRGRTLAVVGPWVLLVLSGLVGAAATAVLRVLMRTAREGRSVISLGAAAALFVAAAALAKADLTLYVSLYARLHTLLEVLAEFSACVAMMILITLAARDRPIVERLVERFASGCALVATVFVIVSPLRGWVDESLRHAWREPVYVGRMLSRVQIAEGFIRDPRGWRGATMSSVVKLRERYDIATTSRSPAWDEPLHEPEWMQKKLGDLRKGKTPNIVVFYVDTLRSDVARDARIMPNLARFSAESVDFRRAYTTGSDTIHALPGMTGGSYDLFTQQPNDLLRVAKRAGYNSVLTVAQSAHEFLSKLLPQFQFGETVLVPDYSPGNENVWGYGADQPTAARLVDRSLDWLRQHQDEPSLLWMFNFDVHNWRELDEAYVRQAGKQYKLLDESDPVWRYRVVAHDVDVQFGRFLDGLRDLGIADDTVLLFVSDHGEGLGREGFWVHSVFLWESLVHVPLMIRAPGVAPATVNDVVSIVDVAPTLARFMVPDAETDGYQGEDLLSYVVPNRPPRRRPLVLIGTLKELPVRLGIIDPNSAWKLVLPLEGAVPELYDLRGADPDAVDVSGEHRPEMLHLLNELVRAPLFPRLSDVGTNGPLDQAATEGRTAIEKEGLDKPPEGAEPK